ncbi:MAG: hypothetical protein HC905_24925 [Bacteroidales bacterium]|nr:hypothetical protein [Bacteroidales bacterium]
MIDAVFKKVLEGVKELMMDIDSASVQSFMDRYYNRGTYDYQGLAMYLSDLESELGQVQLAVPDSALIRAEYANAFDMIRLGAGIKQYIETKDTVDAEIALKVPLLFFDVTIFEISSAS